MADWQKENEIRLDILEAVARSQKALATMAEAIAQLPVQNTSDGERTARSLEVLSRYQFTLAEKILGIRIRNIRTGTPLQPWLHPQVCGKRRSRPAIRSDSSPRVDAVGRPLP